MMESRQKGGFSKRFQVESISGVKTEEVMMKRNVIAVICSFVLGCVGFGQAGLVAHYDFNETGGTVLGDSVGSADGTATDVGFVAAGGAFGNAGTFNGTSSVVSFGSGSHPASFDVGTNDFTISGWFKTPQQLLDGVNPTLFRSMGSSSNGGWAFEIGRNDRSYRGKVFFTLGGSESKQVFSDVRLDDDEWHFILVVRSSDTLSMYIDNVLQAASATATANTTGTAPAATEAFFGLYSSVYYTGRMDELRIYNEALDSTAINGLWTAGQSAAPVLVAQYEFDETGGTVLNDSVGSADGTATDVSFVTSGISSGTFGNAGSFNGTSSQVSFGSGSHPASFDLGTNEFTISGWFKMPLNDQDLNLTVARSAASYSNGGWAFEIGRSSRSYAGKLFFTLGGSDYKQVMSNVRLDDDRWHFVSVSRSGDLITMYIDNILQSASETASASTTGTAPSATESFFGRYGSLYYPGQLDAWSIYTGALDDAAIDTLWTAGLGDAELVAHYDFNETGGSVLNDSAGSADGTATDVTFVSSGVSPATFGNAGSFNGTSSTVNFGSGSHPAVFDLGVTDFTISGWFKTPVNEQGVNITVFRSMGSVTVSGWSLEIGRSDRSYAGKLFFTLGGEDFANAQVMSDGRLDDDQWHFVAVVNSSGTLSMYVDNVLQLDDGSSAGLVSGSAGATDEAFFGQYGSIYYTGQLDEWSIYSGALGETAIGDLWDAGQGPGPIEIVSITSVSNLIELVVSSDMPSICWPKGLTALDGGSWSNVAHSTDGVAPFMVTNLEYSTASDGNFTIYVEMDSDQKFFKIDGGQE